ncbi:MAG: IS21 family transposase [Syntrophorhabdaceae bacterium]|nr:IS21 family transposase [Syntrophorhabdaceae bacterium]
MARRDIPMNEVMETIYQWHEGRKIKQISTSLGIDRKTVRKYLGLLNELTIGRGDPLPDEQELIGRVKEIMAERAATYQAPGIELVGCYRDDIERWFEDSNMTAKQVWRLLKENYQINVAYTTVKRYVRKEFPRTSPHVTVRIETPPGDEAQVDFGYAGLMYDPVMQKKRKAWAFIMTLSYSRHRFVRFVFNQDIPSWLDCHERAFAWFGGVPSRITLDNLKSGVVKPDIYDPPVNYAYADLERHYGFVADPAKKGDAEQKGKVERAVATVKQQLLAGRTFIDINDANERARVWLREEVGQEVHGTTKRKPYPVFLAEEKQRLKLLPLVPFERPLWKKCTVHPDHHIVFDKSYYSLPTRYIGKKVWVKGTYKTLEIFLDHERIKMHPRAPLPGTFMTDQTDYPPEKLAYLMATPTWCRKKAADYGPNTAALMNAVLEEHAMRNLRKAQAILRLAEKYTDIIEKVAERALLYGNVRYKSIKTMLEKEVIGKPSVIAVAPLSELGKSFLRSPDSFKGVAP